MSQLSAPAPNVTLLSDLIPQLLQASPRDEALTDYIYTYLCEPDQPALKAATSALATARAMPSSNKVEEGLRNKAVGKAFEQVLASLFGSGQALKLNTNVRTMISELDQLLEVLPLGLHWVPMLAESGSMILGEAKCTKKGPSTELIHETIGLAKQHGTKTCFVFFGCASRQIAREPRTSLAMAATGGCTIVPIGQKQINQIANGEPVLKVISDQYKAVRTHLMTLEI